MLTKIPDIDVPIDDIENIVPVYSLRWGSSKGYTFYPNCVFEDNFRILKFEKTSSGSPYMLVESQITGYKYSMRWMQMKDLFLNGEISNGEFRGLFTFDLKWDYYTLVLFDPAALPKLISRGLEVKDARWWNDYTTVEISMVELDQ